MQTYKIRKISEQIFSGGTPSTSKPEYWNGNLHWLSSGETRNNYIHDTERRITYLGANNSSTRLANIDDIVIASAGQGFTRGQASLLKIDTYINQSIIAIKVNRSICLPRFLFYNLLSRYSELRLLSDSSSTRGSITTKMIGDMNIKLPPMIIQQHIVNTISSLLLKFF